MNEHERAEAWKAMALGVRKLFGRLCELSGDACGTLQGVVDCYSDKLPPPAAERCRVVSEELHEAVTSMHLEVPHIIAHEVRAADKANQ